MKRTLLIPLVYFFVHFTIFRFETIKEKNSSLYGLRLRSTNQYINEKNRSDLLSVNEQHRFHEVELCFNLVKLLFFSKKLYLL